jgi:hypothetical protein
MVERKVGSVMSVIREIKITDNSYSYLLHALYLEEKKPSDCGGWLFSIRFI